MASSTASSLHGSAAPAAGQIVHVRTRNHLVEGVVATAGGTVVQLACVDDDNQGARSEVIWELEFDARILDEEAWKSIGDTKKYFDPPRHFAAVFNTVRLVFPLIPDPSRLRVVWDTTASNQLRGSGEEEAFHGSEARLRLAQTSIRQMIPETCRRQGMSDPTLHWCKKKFASTGESAPRRPKQSEQRNACYARNADGPISASNFSLVS
jgi:hypothetical protein